MVGQHLHLGVLVVSRAESRAPRGTRRCPRRPLDEVVQLVLRGHAHVQVAVGRHDDAVHAAFDERSDSATSVGRAPGRPPRSWSPSAPQVAHRAQDALPVGAASRPPAPRVRSPAVRDQGHAVVLAPGLATSVANASLTRSGSLSGIGHGAGHVDQEHEVRAGFGRSRRPAGSVAKPMTRSFVSGVPRTVGSSRSEIPNRSSPSGAGVGGNRSSSAAPRCARRLRVCRRRARPVAHHAAQVGSRRPCPRRRRTWRAGRCGRGHEAGLLTCSRTPRRRKGRGVRRRRAREGNRRTRCPHSSRPR